MKQKKLQWSIVVCLILIGILWVLPTGFEKAGAAYRDGGERVPARVLSVDNSTVINTGLVHAGEQRCQVELLSGSHKGQVYTGENILTGSLESDKIYETGDKALVLASFADEDRVSVSMIDHYRLDLEALLLGIFFLFLALFAGWTGVRAILSFVLSVLMIWKVLVPGCLRGVEPILIGGGVTALLTLMIIALVFGFDKRCLAAVSGALAGLTLTCILGIVCTNTFRIQGAVMSFSESLLYSGYGGLDLTKIFMASIFVGSSGAMMDLTVDIARHQIIKGGEEIHFTQNEFKILELLAVHAGKVLTYDFILEHVWGPFSGSNGNQILRVNMANIRRKLKENPSEPKYIHTELGIGYRMLED